MDEDYMEPVTKTVFVPVDNIPIFIIKMEDENIESRHSDPSSTPQEEEDNKLAAGEETQDDGAQDEFIGLIDPSFVQCKLELENESEEDCERRDEWLCKNEDCPIKDEFPVDTPEVKIENDLEIQGLPADGASRNSNSHFNHNFDERIEAPTTDDADVEETYADDYQDEKSLDVHFLVEELENESEEDCERSDEWLWENEDCPIKDEFPVDTPEVKIENDLEIQGLPADGASRNSNSHFNHNFDERIEAPTTDDADVEETYADDYQDEKSLDVHFLVEAARKKRCEQKRLTCDECSAVFRYQSTFDYHKKSQCGTKMIAITNALVTKNKEQQFTCNVCYKQMCSRTSLMVHMRLHTGERPFSCGFCDRAFTQKAHLKDHSQKVHSNKIVKQKFGCNNCGADFLDKKSLKLHLRVHQDIRPYECSVCHKRYLSKSNLSTHMFAHAAHRNYHCVICNKSFLRKNNLMDHLKIHSEEKPYACPVCSKKYSDQAKMKFHLRRHIGDLKYSCRECGKKFACGYDLRIHERTHTGEKPYSCGICGRLFNRKSILETHMTLHTGKKNFACSECDKTFNRKSKLKTHLTEHTGEKYQCEICQRVFSCKAYLIPHMRTHSGEKPFVCPVCKRAFAGRGSLRYHMKKVHAQLCQSISQTVLEPVIIQIE